MAGRNNSKIKKAQRDSEAYEKKKKKQIEELETDLRKRTEKCKQNDKDISGREKVTVCLFQIYYWFSFDYLIFSCNIGWINGTD